MAHIEAEALLDKETLTALVRECVAVVKPGEVLVIRKADLRPAQMAEYNEAMRYVADDLGIKILVVIGDEIGVAQPVPAAEDSDEAFAGRVAKALGSPQVRAAGHREALRQGARPSRG